MPDALKVEIVNTGAEKVARDLENITKQLNATGRAMDAANRPRDAKGRFVSTGGGSSARGGSVLAAAQAEKDIVKQKYSEDDKLAARAQKQAESGARRVAQMARQNNPNIAGLIGSTRIGFDGNGRMEIMPLISGLTRAFGPIAPIMTAAMAAIQAFDEAAKEAAQNMRNFRMAQYTSGGTTGEVAAGKVLGRYLGYDETDAGKAFAAQSREFSNRISPGGDPNAQNFANQYGIHDTGLYGGTDKMRNFLDWTEKLRNMPDTQAMRAARATGTEELLPIRDLNQQTYDALRQEAVRQGGLNDPDRLRREADRHAREVIDDMNNPFSRENLGRAWHEGWGGGGMGGVPPIGAGASGQGQNHQQRQTTAAERTAAATESLNQLARAGMYGGGERASGAIPSAFTGAGWQIKQLTAQAHALGAFSL